MDSKLVNIIEKFRDDDSPVMSVTDDVVVLLLYVPSQQLWSLRDGQFT